MTQVFDTFSACPCGPIRKPDGLWIELFTVLACCLVAIGLTGCGFHTDASVAGPLRVLPSTVAFGAVPVGQIATSKVSFLNEGSAPITISQLNIAGQSFSLTSQGKVPIVVNAGDTYSFDIVFMPEQASSYSGQCTAMNAAGQLLAQVAIMGLGIGASISTPTLTVSPGSLAFGNVTVNTASTQPVTLTSTGTAPVTINSTALSGKGFTISGADFPVTLNPTQAVTLNVQFDPTTAGAVTGQLTIQSNSSTNSTVVISLTGTGTGTAVPAVLSALSCSNSSVTGSGSDGCTVTLSAAAGSGGLTVALASNNAAVTVPAMVVVPANASSAGFTATVSSVTTAQAVTLTASAGGVSKSFALQLNAAVPTLTISPGSLTFGNVTVNTASTLPVTLTSTGTAPVTVNSAALSGTGFTMSGATFPVTLNPTQSLTLNVQFDPATAGAVTGQLTIRSNSSTNGTVIISLTGTGMVPVALSALSCSNASFTGFGSDTCTVTLIGAAGTGGVSVALASSNAAVTVPATVVVPANASGAGFTATVLPVTTGQAVTLTASSGGVSKSFVLQLNAAVPTLTISPASLAFGDVTVNKPLTLPVTLTSTGTASVTINSAALSGTGFTVSGATFPVTLNPSLGITLDVQFDPTTPGAVTGQLTIKSNSSTNGTVVIILTGTGETVSYQVDLSWEAPISSADPVAGYNIFRSTGGSSAYQLLNSSLDTQTTYVDSNVQSGQTFDYIVKSVDASGVESTPSNQIVVTIP